MTMHKNYTRYITLKGRMGKLYILYYIRKLKLNWVMWIVFDSFNWFCILD